ncbi:TrmB family transcriptional regulator [Candidatus Pacearchaeota archaeon]|nr:TrmB family transcriptional regulator [Candidatus Pacearchaeota archaeon]
MKIYETLEETGLKKGEIKVYLALLKLGSSPISKLKESTGLHRTTIYDFVEKLLNRALVSYNTQKGVRYYKATEPRRLLEELKEKEEKIKAILPEIEKITKDSPKDISVETYRGREGNIILMNDILETGGEYLVLSAEEQRFEEIFSIHIAQHFKKEKMLGITSRALTREDTDFYFKAPTTTYRFLPKNFFGPTAIAIYGDKVGFFIWEPLSTIIIKNKELAEGYKKHFELLWKTAKKKPLSKKK